MEMSWQRSCRDVLLIWLVKVQERVKRVDTFVRDNFQGEWMTSRVIEINQGRIGGSQEIGMLPKGKKVASCNKDLRASATVAGGATKCRSSE